MSRLHATALPGRRRCAARCAIALACTSAPLRWPGRVLRGAARGGSRRGCRIGPRPSALSLASLLPARRAAMMSLAALHRSARIHRRLLRGRDRAGHLGNCSRCPDASGTGVRAPPTRRESFRLTGGRDDRAAPWGGSLCAGRGGSARAHRPCLVAAARSRVGLRARRRSDPPAPNCPSTKRSWMTDHAIPVSPADPPARQRFQQFRLLGSVRVARHTQPWPTFEASFGTLLGSERARLRSHAT